MKGHPKIPYVVVKELTLGKAYQSWERFWGAKVDVWVKD